MSDSLRLQILEIVQRSRKAARLYSSSLTRVNAENLEVNEKLYLTEIQTKQWHDANQQLVKYLTVALNQANSVRLRQGVLDYFFEVKGILEDINRELVSSQTLLIIASESGDYLRAYQLSRHLVKLNAQLQAFQANFYELNRAVKNLVKQSELSPSKELDEAIELQNEGEEHGQDKACRPSQGNVVEFRRRQA